MMIRIGLALMAMMAAANIAMAADAGADTYKAKVPDVPWGHGPGGFARREVNEGKADRGSGSKEGHRSADDYGNQERNGQDAAVQGQLTDAQIKDAVAYFRTFLK